MSFSVLYLPRYTTQLQKLVITEYSKLKQLRMPEEWRGYYAVFF